MFREVATLVHLIESSKPAARAQAVRWVVPLEVPRLLERRPRLAVPRERSINELLVRQIPPWHENSWPIRVDLGYFCESALWTRQIEFSLCTVLSATSQGLGMTLGMALRYPVQSVPSSGTALTAHTVRLPDFCDDAGLFHDPENKLLGNFPG